MKKGSKASKVSFLIVLTLLLTLFTSTTAAAQKTGPDQGPIAIVTVKANEVSWQPQIESAGFVLTISGPGDFYLQREYQPGDRLIFSPEDNAGDPLPDGSYTYELLLLPVEALAVSDDARRGLVPGGAEPPVLSGNVSISGGRFVTQDVTERASHAMEPRFMTPLAPSIPTDQVTYDDLIVIGSVCVGQDCVNGESFGFDTLRLKENNLRIRFYDTSSSASFPTNDWQITANDSANGGANKFSIDDIDSGRTPFTIEAGTRANALYVDDSGRVGLGTSTPAEDLHIWYGDTPTIRLHQSGSGWAPQTWDLAANEANFFIRDVTNSSKLPFRIRPNAPNDSLTIQNSGNVGVGTWSPGAALHVVRTGSDPTLALERTDSHSNKWAFSSTSDGLNIAVNDSTDPQVLVDDSGNLTVQGSLQEGSDVNLKENFALVDSREVLETLAELPISSWNFKFDDPQIRHLGPMAQDFYQAFGLGTDDKHIAPLDTNGVTLAAVQGLYEMMGEKEAQIRILQEQNVELKARLTALERAVAALPWLVAAVLLLGVAGMMGWRRYSTKG
jgi:hypothetical protein